MNANVIYKKLNIAFEFGTSELSAGCVYVRTQFSSDRCVYALVFEYFAKSRHGIAVGSHEIRLLDFVYRNEIYVYWKGFGISVQSVFQSVRQFFRICGRIVFAGYKGIFEGYAPPRLFEISSTGIEKFGNIPLIVDRHYG